MARRWGPALAAAGALAVAVGAGLEAGRSVDRRAFGVLNQGRGARADRLFTGITEMGSIGASAGAAVVLALSGRRRAAVDALAAAGATWTVGQLLKRLVGRPRPYQAEADHRLLIGEPHGTSWPSSHPAVLLTFVTVVGRDLGLGPGARAAFGALAGTVGLSRVYVGVHYPSDVAGGLLLGRAVAGAWTAAVSPRFGRGTA